MLALLPFLTLAFALPVPPPVPRDVGTETCTSLISGLLTSASGTIFHVNTSSGVLSYGPDSTGQGLAVSFERCDPNFENWPQNSTLLTGHLSLPTTYPLQCLTVLDPANPEPHNLSLSDCSISEDSSQILQQFLQLTASDGSVTYVWAGFTDNRGDVQDAAACGSGLLGFLGGSDSGPVQVECLGDENVEEWTIASQASQ